MNYQFNEAYMLMFYEDPKTKNGFLIWNSRDGVTPFIVFENGVEYYHSHWSLDQRVTNPEYINKQLLLPGQRIFRDMTDAEAMEAVMKRLERAKGTEYEVEEGTEYYNELIKGLTREFTGEPCVRKVVTAGILP